MKEPEYIELEKAFEDGSIYKAGLDELRSYAMLVRKMPDVGSIPAQARTSQYFQTIRHLIEQHEARIGTSKSVLWSRIAALAAVLAALLALLQWLFPRQIATPEHGGTGAASQQSSPKTQAPTKTDP